MCKNILMYQRAQMRPDSVILEKQDNNRNRRIEEASLSGIRQRAIFVLITALGSKQYGKKEK